MKKSDNREFRRFAYKIKHVEDHLANQQLD